MIEDGWFQCIYYIVSWVYFVNWQTKNLESGQVNVISLRKEGKKDVPILTVRSFICLGGKNVCDFFFSSDFEILNNLKH